MNHWAAKKLSGSHFSTLQDMLGSITVTFSIYFLKGFLIPVLWLVIKLQRSVRIIKVLPQNTCKDSWSSCKRGSESSKTRDVTWNSSYKWACVEPIIPKTDKEGFCFTINLQTINAQKKLNVWPSPLAKPILPWLSESWQGSKVDLIHAFLAISARKGLSKMSIIPYTW